MVNWSGRHKEATTILNDEFDRFQGEFDVLRDKLARLAGDTVKEFNDSPQKLSDLKSVIDGRLSLIEGEIGDLGRQLRVEGSKAAGRVEQKVHEQPLAALAIAAGVGFLAAQLLRRCRRSS